MLEVIMFVRRGMPLAIAVGAAACCGEQARGSIVWNGPSVLFTKADFADPTLAVNQDRLTPSVWITRGSTRGLYNASSEAGYTHFLSPSGTLWADGLLTSFGTLAYTDWETWANSHVGGPPATVGVDAVVRLVAEDVYLHVRITSWSSTGTGGGFSYERSTAPGPASLAALGLGGLTLVRRRSRRS